MTAAVAVALAILVVVLLLLEHRHADRMTLVLAMKGDIKRESAFLAQYGQSVATPIAAWFAAVAFKGDWRVFLIVVLPVLANSVTCMLLKRCLGRVRPNRENAGRFTGFDWRHKNSRESFPSSHSACAFALTVALIPLWPSAALIFWLLAFVTAGLRYVMNAHFPSDVIAGALLGVLLGSAVFHGLDPLLFPNVGHPVAHTLP